MSKPPPCKWVQCGRYVVLADGELDQKYGVEELWVLNDGEGGPYDYDFEIVYDRTVDHVAVLALHLRARTKDTYTIEDQGLEGNTTRVFEDKATGNAGIELYLSGGVRFQIMTTDVQTARRLQKMLVRVYCTHHLYLPEGASDVFEEYYNHDTGLYDFSRLNMRRYAPASARIVQSVEYDWQELPDFGLGAPRPPK